MALKTFLKFIRKVTKKENQSANYHTEIELELSDWNAVIKMIERAPLDCLSLPIEALVLFSKMSPDIIQIISPQVTPKLLLIFRNHHNESQLGQELVNLFKQWSNNEACRLIMVETFIPFIMEIVGQYYHNTPNAENKSQIMSLQEKLANLDLVG